MRSHLGHLFGALVATASLLLQGSAVLGQGDASDRTDSGPAILKKFLEVNEVWLNPKAERLSYVLTGTIQEQPNFVERVWIDGPNIRWELDQLGEKPSAYAVVIRGDSAVYVKGPEKLLLKPSAAGDVHPFVQAVTWRSAVHTVYEKGIPDDARLVERKKTDEGELVILEMTVPAHRRVGLGLRGPYLGYAGVAGSPPTNQYSKVRLHIRLPDHFPILEEYPEQSAEFRFGDQPIRFDRGLAPSRITYSDRKSDGDRWELEMNFQKYESLWLLQMAKNRQSGLVRSALEVSDVSTAPPDRTLFEVPER